MDDQYQLFVDSLELNTIETVEFGGARFRPGFAPQTKFSVETGYVLESGTIYFRFNVRAQLLEEEGRQESDEDTTDPLGELGVTLLLIFQFAEPNAEPDPEHIERFGSEQATTMAFPYLREAIQVIAQRLNFPGVVLPMIQTGETV